MTMFVPLEVYDVPVWKSTCLMDSFIVVVPSVREVTVPVLKLGETGALYAGSPSSKIANKLSRFIGTQSSQLFADQWLMCLVHLL